MIISSMLVLQELNLHYTVHTSLDVVDEKLASVSSSKNTNDNRELYLGSLSSSEHQKVYGYVTNTKIKLVIVVDNSTASLRSVTQSEASIIQYSQ